MFDIVEMFSQNKRKNLIIFNEYFTWFEPKCVFTVKRATCRRVNCVFLNSNETIRSKITSVKIYVKQLKLIF